MKGIASWSRFSWGLNPTKSIQIPLGSVRGWPGCISGPGPWAQVNAVCQDFYRARPVDNPPAIGFIGLFPLSRVWGIDAPGELDDGIYDLGRPESVVERARWGERLKGTDFIRHIFLAGRVLGDILWSEPLIFVAGLPQASRGVHSLRRPAPQAKAYFNYPRAPLYSQKAHQPFCPEFSRPPPPPPLPSPPIPRNFRSRSVHPRVSVRGSADARAFHGCRRGFQRGGRVRRRRWGRRRSGYGPRPLLQWVQVLRPGGSRFHRGILQGHRCRKVGRACRAAAPDLQGSDLEGRANPRELRYCFLSTF